MKYPFKNKYENMQTRAAITFIVEKDGSIHDFENRKKTQFTAVDSAVINVLKQMPKWKPAKQNGEVVRSKFTFVIGCIKLED